MVLIEFNKFLIICRKVLCIFKLCDVLLFLNIKNVIMILIIKLIMLMINIFFDWILEGIKKCLIVLKIIKIFIIKSVILLNNVVSILKCL